MPDLTQVKVNWETENEQNYTNFTVERSNDGGKTYNIIGSIQGSGVGNYGFTDINPTNGVNYYRLKQEDIDNAITYSSIVQVQFTNQASTLAKSNISVYPNPASSILNLTISTAINNSSSSYNIQVTNSSGIMVKTLNITQPSWQWSLGSLAPGAYIIKVLNNQGGWLIGQTKFVKE